VAPSSDRIRLVALDENNINVSFLQLKRVLGSRDDKVVNSNRNAEALERFYHKVFLSKKLKELMLFDQSPLLYCVFNEVDLVRRKRRFKSTS